MRHIVVIQLFPLSLFFSVFSNTDDIIMCRKIEGVNTEERKNETQNNKTSTSVSIQQSDADKHRQQRGKVYKKITRGKKSLKYL